MVKTARGRSRTAVCIFPVWSVSSNVSSSSCRGQQRLVTCQAKLRRQCLFQSVDACSNYQLCVYHQQSTGFNGPV
ncbi:hypothetical protein WJX79_009648 [Trebouxia sp. C0005]